MNWPVGEGHALEKFGERRVDGEMWCARLAEVISLTSLFINSVEVVAFLRRMLDVRSWDHKMTAVDDLRLSPVWFLQSEPEVCLLTVGVVVVVLLPLHGRSHSPLRQSSHYTPPAPPAPPAAAVPHRRSLFSRAVWLTRDIPYYCLPDTCEVLWKRNTRVLLIVSYFKNAPVFFSSLNRHTRTPAGL